MARKWGICQKKRMPNRAHASGDDVRTVIAGSDEAGERSVIVGISQQSIIHAMAEGSAAAAPLEH